MPITYTIDLHDITELTWPMWWSCGIECPAMIGADCPGKDGTRYMDGPADAAHYSKTCPGWSAKFPHAAAEVLHAWTLSSFQDDQCGNAVDGDAWFARFDSRDKEATGGAMGAGVILTVASNGEVGTTQFSTAESLDEAWNKLLAETADDDEDDEDPEDPEDED